MISFASVGWWVIQLDVCPLLLWPTIPPWSNVPSMLNTTLTRNSVTTPLLGLSRVTPHIRLSFVLPCKPYQNVGLPHGKLSWIWVIPCTHQWIMGLLVPVISTNPIGYQALIDYLSLFYNMGMVVYSTKRIYSEHIYQQFPIDRKDYHLLGFTFNAAFNLFWNALSFRLKNKCYDLPVNYLCCYKDPDKVFTGFYELQSLFHHLGLQSLPEKDCPQAMAMQGLSQAFW